MRIDRHKKSKMEDRSITIILEPNNIKMMKKNNNNTLMIHNNVVIHTLNINIIIKVFFFDTFLKF